MAFPHLQRLRSEPTSIADQARQARLDWTPWQYRRPPGWSCRASRASHHRDRLARAGMQGGPAPAGGESRLAARRRAAKRQASLYSTDARSGVSTWCGTGHSGSRTLARPGGDQVRTTATVEVRRLARRWPRGRQSLGPPPASSAKESTPTPSKRSPPRPRTHVGLGARTAFRPAMSNKADSLLGGAMGGAHRSRPAWLSRKRAVLKTGDGVQPRPWVRIPPPPLRTATTGLVELDTPVARVASAGAAYRPTRPFRGTKPRIHSRPDHRPHRSNARRDSSRHAAWSPSPFARSSRRLR